jgi:hypothetical protein
MCVFVLDRTGAARAKMYDRSEAATVDLELVLTRERKRRLRVRYKDEAVRPRSRWCAQHAGRVHHQVQLSSAPASWIQVLL